MNGPKGLTPRGAAHIQYTSPGAVRCCIMPTAARTTANHVTARVATRTPPLAKVDLAHQNNNTKPTASVSDTIVDAGSIDSGRAAPDAMSNRRLPSRSAAAGEIASRRDGGSGTTWRATTSRHAISATSSHRSGGRPTSGRTITTRTRPAITTATAIQGATPANANSVAPRRMEIARDAAEALDRGFRIVVLVLMSVVPRIVVLISREIDL